MGCREDRQALDVCFSGPWITRAFCNYGTVPVWTLQKISRVSIESTIWLNFIVLFLSLNNIGSLIYCNFDRTTLRYFEPATIQSIRARDQWDGALVKQGTKAIYALTLILLDKTKEVGRGVRELANCIDTCPRHKGEPGQNNVRSLVWAASISSLDGWWSQYIHHRERFVVSTIVGAPHPTVKIRRTVDMYKIRTP